MLSILDQWQDADISSNLLVPLNMWESLVNKAKLNIFYVDLPTANFYINQIIDNCESDIELKNFVEYKVRALRLSAQVECNSFYMLGETIAKLNCALVLSCNNYLDFNSAMIEMKIASIQLEMNLPNQALKIINRVIPCVLANGCNFDIARSLLLFTKCTIASAIMENTTSKDYTLRKCANMLDKVMYYLQLDNAYSKIRDILYLQAILYDEINLINERNKCSYEYRILEEQFNICDGYNILVGF